MFTATVEKSNDGPTGERVAFTLKSVPLHHDAETDITTTAPVVIPSADPTPKPNKARLSPNAKSMLGILEEVGKDGMTLQAWYEVAKAEGMGVSRRASLSDAKRELSKKQYVYEENGVWRVWPIIQPTVRGDPGVTRYGG